MKHATSIIYEWAKGGGTLTNLQDIYCVEILEIMCGMKILERFEVYCMQNIRKKNRRYKEQ